MFGSSITELRPKFALQNVFEKQNKGASTKICLCHLACIESKRGDILTPNFVGVIDGPLETFFGKKVFQNSRHKILP